MRWSQMGDLFPRQILDNEDYGANYMQKRVKRPAIPQSEVSALRKASSGGEWD
jgi:hypothetical protein